MLSNENFTYHSGVSVVDNGTCRNYRLVFYASAARSYTVFTYGLRMKQLRAATLLTDTITIVMSAWNSGYCRRHVVHSFK